MWPLSQLSRMTHVDHWMEFLQAIPSIRGTQNVVVEYHRMFALKKKKKNSMHKSHVNSMNLQQYDECQSARVAYITKNINYKLYSLNWCEIRNACVWTRKVIITFLIFFTQTKTQRHWHGHALTQTRTQTNAHLEMCAVRWSHSCPSVIDNRLNEQTSKSPTTTMILTTNWRTTVGRTDKKTTEMKLAELPPHASNVVARKIIQFFFRIFLGKQRNRSACGCSWP